MRGQLSYIQGNLSLLRKMNWIDRQTRAVFVEFSVYNPNIDLVMVSTFLFEFLSAGSIVSQARFDTLNLFSEIGEHFFSLKIMSEIIFLIFIGYFMMCQLVAMFNQEYGEYFLNFWTLIEWCIILSGCISLFMLLVRINSAQEVLDFFKRTAGYGYMKLQKVNNCNQTLIFCLGLCAFFGTIKLLKLFRFNSHALLVGLTLKCSLKELFSCSVAFFTIWIAFVQVMHFLFGSYLGGYSTLVTTMETAFQMMLGKFDSSELSKTSPILGPVIFSAYNVVILYFVLNIFVSVITETFDQVRGAARENPTEFDLFKHATRKLKMFCQFENSNVDVHPPPELYRDHLSVLSNRVNGLINYLFRVNKYLFDENFIFCIHFKSPK